jgi:hypothetical protein
MGRYSEAVSFHQQRERLLLYIAMFMMHITYLFQ